MDPTPRALLLALILAPAALAGFAVEWWRKRRREGAGWECESGAWRDYEPGWGAIR